MMLRVGLANFSKGVLGDTLQSRVDVAAYNAGLKRGENIVVMKQGGFTIRPGWRFIADSLGDDERVVPFQFSDQQSYALILGQEYMQPLSAGGVVTETELLITGATSANPVVLTAAFHAFEAGDRVFVQGVDGELGDLLNGRIWTVAASVDDNRFSINADGSGLAAFTSSVSGITRTGPVTPPPAPPSTPPPYEPPPPPIVVGPGGVYDGGGDPPWSGRPIGVDGAIP